jgi:RHS repeat-associated protein
LREEGNRISVVEPEQQETTYAYDELGKLLRVVQPGNRVTSHRYDPNRNRVLQTDANGHEVRMTYDELGRLDTFVQDPSGLAFRTSHTYDANGNETVLTDPKGQTVTSTYDEVNRLKTKAYAYPASDPVRPWRHTTSIAYAYDANGNLTRIEDSVASGTDPPSAPLVTTRDYDDLDRLLSETSPLPDGGSRTVAYTYFANGTRKTVTGPSAETSSYTYDGQNRLATATTAGGVTSYAYFPDDLLRSVTYPSGVTATHAYDKADRLTSLVNARGATTVSSFTYGYDRNGNRLSQVEVNGGPAETTGYTYDALNRLDTVTYPVDANYPAGRVATYALDDVGNRTRETERTTAGAVLADKQGVFDNLNRLTTLTDLVDGSKTTTFSWDANGNQHTKTVGAVTTEYRYDCRDRLVEVVEGSSTPGRFQYDFQGRRSKKIGSDGVVQYVYDQTSVLAEFDGSASPVAKYEYGSDRLISMARSGEGRRWYSLDGLRSGVNLTDDSGATVASYHLDAWGNFRFPSELSASRNRFAFTGYEWDQELGLFNAKARYFDPTVGRFTSQDSFIGEINDPPSLHRFFYANANPTRFVDPTGHLSVKVAWETIKNVPRAIAEPALEVYDVALVGGAKSLGIPAEFIELQSALGRRQRERIEEGQSFAEAATKGSAEAVAAVATRGLSVIGQGYVETAVDYSQGKLTVDQLDDRLTSIGVGTGAGAALGGALERAGGRTWTGRPQPVRVIEGSGRAMVVPAATEARTAPRLARPASKPAGNLGGDEQLPPIPGTAGGTRPITGGSQGADALDAPIGAGPASGGPRSPVLEMQRDLSLLVNKQGSVVDRWLQSSSNRWAKLYRETESSSPNFAKGIRGRILDIRMRGKLREQFGDVPGARIDQTIPGSGNNLRPDLYLPSVGGRRVIFDVGSPSKMLEIGKYKGMADDTIPLVPIGWVP